MSVDKTIDTKHLESLLERVTLGEWDFQEQEGAPGQCFCAQVFTSIGEGDSIAAIDPTESEDEATANAELMAMSKTLARRVIAAEKLADVLKAFRADHFDNDSINSGPPVFIADIMTALSEWDKSQ